MTGRLLKILANTGDTIAVGSPLAELSVGDGDGASAQAAAPVAAPPPPAVAAPAPAAPPPAVPPAAPSTEASEGAQLLAEARGIDLQSVKGTGRGGAITRRDVLQAIEDREQATAPPATAGGSPRPPAAVAATHQDPATHA